MLRNTIILMVMSLFLMSNDQPDLPVLNQKILEFVLENEGKKVKSGEAWDLIEVPLAQYGAKWSPFKYGRIYNPKQEMPMPGDIVKFQGVTLTYHNNYRTQTVIDMKQHVAVITEVSRPHKFKIAHQNNGFSADLVGISDINTNHIKKGELTFYRPIPGQTSALR